VVSATTRPLYPGKETPYPLYRRLGGPQSWSGQVRKISPPPGFDVYGKVNVSKAKYLTLTCRAGTGNEQVFEVSGVPRNFVRGGGSINSIEARENGDLGAVPPPPYSRVLEAAVIWYKKFHFV